MTDLPLAPRDRPWSGVTPLIPLALAHPGLSMAQTWSIVRAYRWLSILIIVTVLALTALALMFWPRTYTATVALMVNYEVNDPLNGKDLPVGQVGSFIATQVELMQTPEVLLAVVDRLGLTEKADYALGYRGESGTLREWAAALVGKTLSIYQSQRGSQLIYVTYSASDATEAAQVANTVADIYKEHDALRGAAAPGERAKRYAQQLSELKAKVDEAQRQVTAFHQRNGLIDEGNDSKVDVQLLATLDERLLAAQSVRRIAEVHAEQDPSSSDQVLASAETQLLKAQLAAQELRLAQLNRLYTPLYPDVREAQMQVDSTQRSLTATLQSHAKNARAGLSAALRVEQSLQDARGTQRTKVLSKSQLQDESAKYLLELESAQTVYKRALEGYDQIMFAATSNRGSNVSLVSRASPPVKASTPRVRMVLALGAGLALLLGLGIPMICEMFNRRVRCRDDVERQYGVPVLVEFGRLPMRART